MHASQSRSSAQLGGGSWHSPRMRPTTKSSHWSLSRHRRSWAPCTSSSPQCASHPGQPVAPPAPLLYRRCDWRTACNLHELIPGATLCLSAAPHLGGRHGLYRAASAGRRGGAILPLRPGGGTVMHVCPTTVTTHRTHSQTAQVRDADTFAESDLQGGFAAMIRTTQFATCARAQLTAPTGQWAQTALRASRASDHFACHHTAATTRCSWVPVRCYATDSRGVGF
jgi:hypothetical protein